MGLKAKAGQLIKKVSPANYFLLPHRSIVDADWGAVLSPGYSPMASASVEADGRISQKQRIPSTFPIEKPGHLNSPYSARQPSDKGPG